MGNGVFADRNLQNERRRTLRLFARRARAHGRRIPRQPSRRTAAVDLESQESCQDVTSCAVPGRIRAAKVNPALRYFAMSRASANSFLSTRTAGRVRQ